MKSKQALFGTNSDSETIKLGRELGILLKEGDIIALVGELGSGKTWFTKGLALGLGINEGTVVTSPSFSLLNEYSGRCILYHMDAYRLKDLTDFLFTGLEEYLYGDGVVALEWADRWPEALPEWSLWVEIKILSDKQREIKFTGNHTRALEIIDDFLTRKNKKQI